MTQIKVGLVAVIVFSAFGFDAKPGQVVPDDVWQKWEGDYLATRLGNGSVRWVPLTETGDAEDVADIDAMGKDALLLYAQGQFGSKLDARLNESNLRQQIRVLQVRKEAQARADAAAALKSPPPSGTGDGSDADTGTGTGNSGSPPPQT